MNHRLHAALVGAIFSILPLHSATAADVAYLQPSPSYRYGYVEPAGSYIHVQTCSIDILCYAAAYPGWHGDAYYGCRTVLVREIAPDGTVVIRRARTC